MKDGDTSNASSAVKKRKAETEEVRVGGVKFLPSGEIESSAFSYRL